MGRRKGETGLADYPVGAAQSKTLTNKRKRKKEVGERGKNTQKGFKKGGSPLGVIMKGGIAPGDKGNSYEGPERKKNFRFLNIPVSLKKY